MPRLPGFIGGSGVTQSIIQDAERTINWYVESAQSQGAKSPKALYPTPGFNPFAIMTDVGGRGSCNAGGRIFVIYGSTLYEVNLDGTFVERGKVAADGFPAQLFYNGQIGGQVGISSGTNFYLFALATNTLTLVLNGICTMAAYAAGYFFAINIFTGIVRLSNLNNGLVFNPGIFFQRELFADPWIAMFTDANNLLWLLGTESFEVWYNTGLSLEPWAPLSGLNGLTGIAAPFAWARTSSGNFWLSANQQGQGQLMLSTGSVPTPVSTYAFSTAMGTYLHTSTIVNAELMAYQQLGHLFVIVHIPAVPATWAYDVNEQNWAERGVWNPIKGRFDIWMPRFQQVAFGQTLVGGWSGTTLATMDAAFTTEFDGLTGIVRERTSPGSTMEHARIPIDQFELLMDTGITSAQSGQGMDPQITLRLSMDGGRTFGNERSAGMGRIGQYMRRVYWNQLGAPADVVFRVRSTDPAPSRIVDCWVNNAER